jgi:hypothetical protein
MAPFRAPPIHLNCRPDFSTQDLIAFNEHYTEVTMNIQLYAAELLMRVSSAFDSRDTSIDAGLY